MIEIREVQQHIENWIKTFLSIPNSKREGLAPCPYSKEALLKNRIDVRCVNSSDLLEILIELTKTWTDDFEIVLLAIVPESLEPHTMEVLLEQSNYILAKYDLIALEDHPNAIPPEDHLEAPKGLQKSEWTNGKYALVFVQRLSKLQKAREQLAKLGYYQSWSKQKLEREHVRFAGGK